MNENDPYNQDPPREQGTDAEPRYQITDSAPDPSPYRPNSPYPNDLGASPYHGLPQDQPVYMAERLQIPDLGKAADYEDKTPYDGPLGVLPLTIIAWLIIFALTCFLAGTNFYSQYFMANHSTVATQAEMMQVNFQSKVTLGLPLFLESLGTAAPPNKVSKTEIQQFNTGPLEARYGYTILACEAIGPEYALSELLKIRKAATLAAIKSGSPEGWPEDLKAPPPQPNENPNAETDETVFRITPEQAKLAVILEEIFEASVINDIDTLDNLAPEKRDLLSEKLGWLGRLAAVPDESSDQAERSTVLGEAANTVKFTTLFAASMIAGVLVALGVALILFVMAAGGGLNYRFQTSANRGGIYAETFAFWMLVFVLGSLGLGILQSVLKMSPVAAIFAQLVVFFGSLIALAYPLVRGVSLDRMLADIGWKARNPIAEIGMGIVGYLGILPLVGIGFVATLIVTLISAQFGVVPEHEFVSNGAAGSHPIADEIATGNPWMVLGVFLTACVAAPIVEETVFRGLLYQQLRDGTKRWGHRFVSVMFSALLSSFVFAIIHPQGLIGVPVLTMLAVGFALVREWRGSLVAPMVMHGIHNSIVTCVLILIM